MICPQCRNVTSDAGRKCVHCGKDLREPGQRPGHIPVTCPLCHVRTEIIGLAGVEVDYCYSCSGIWFDRGELKAFVNLISDQEACQDVMEVLKGMAVAIPGKTKGGYLKCPVCSQRMTHKKFLDVSEIILDRCHDHGIWTDQQDLFMILDMIGSGRIDEVMAKAEKQKEMRLDLRLKDIEAKQTALNMKLGEVNMRSRFHLIMDILGLT